MNEENGKHEFNFFLDKQLQQKLLEANEELLEKEFASSLVQNNGLQSSNSNKNNNVNTGAQQNHKLPKYQDCVHVCGWCPNPNTVYRKSESDAPPRSRGHLAITRDSLYSRDSKSRPQNVDNFVFRHYSDPRRYIEQYRKEHACYDSTNSSATKNEFLETRRFYAYNQYSPLAVSSNANNTLHQSNSYVPQPQLEPPAQSSETITKSHHPQTPSLQYTNRREQKRNTISASLNAKNQHQYKLTKTPPNANKQDRVSDYTEEYIESLEIIKKQRHTGSAKERSSATVNGTGVQKSAATKINVPSANFGGKTLRTANTGSSSENSLPSHFPVHKTGHNTTGRMLDSLACVAGNGAGADKQPQLPSLPNQNTPSKSGTPSSKKRPSASTTSSSTTTITPSTNATGNTTTATTIPLISTASTTPAITTPRIAFANNTNTVKNNAIDNGDIGSYGNNMSSNHSQMSSSLSNHNKNSNNNKSTTKTNKEKDDSSSTTSEVSISQLSTTCLGADATVKSRPKLEASKTYHVFHNDFSTSTTTTNTSNQQTHQQQQQPNQMLSVVWNPGKSAVIEKRQRPGHTINTLAADMMNMAGPFRSSPRRPATEEGGYRAVEFVTKEFIQDAKPLNLRTTDVFRDVARMSAAGVSMSPGLKTNTIKPDLPSSFSLHGVPKKPQFETLKKKRRASKTAVVRRKKEQHTSEQDGRKSWSASTDASNHSISGGGNTLRLKPVPGDGNGNSNTSGNGGSQNGGISTLPVPYFKFWNSSLPPKSREGRRRGGGDKMAADIDMQELAAMVLADENGNGDTDLAHAAKRVLEHRNKSDNEQGIATGDSGITAPIDRPSKEELLESLRNVNQRPSKPSPRPLHLTYYTGDTTTPTTSDSNSTVNDRRSSGDGDVCAGCLDYHQHHNHLLQKRQQPPPQHQNQDDKSNFSPSQLTTGHEDNNTNTCISSDIKREFRKDENSHASRRYDNAVNDRRICTCDKSDASASENKTYDSNSIESGECVDNVTVSNTSMSKRPHKSDHHHLRKEIIFMPEKEGTQILSSARDVNVDDDSDFLSTASDWKQICAEYKSNDSAFLIREAKNEEYKNLIAERFDHKSSLSHQRRIKHLIEQSRLKSHLGNASRIHLTSGIGDEPVRRFIDIKNGINTSTSGDFRSRYRNRYVTRDSNIVREDVGSGVKEVKKKKCKLKFTIISPLARELSSFDNVCENKNDNNNSLPHKPDAGDIDTSPNNEDGLNGHLVDHCHKKTDMNETLKTDDVNFPNSTKTVDSSQKIHVVPFGDTDADCTTGDHCDNHENKGTLSYSNGNVNKSSYSTVAFRSLYKHTGSKSSNLKIHNRDINTTTTTSNFENHSDKAIYQRIPSDTTSRYQDSTGEDNLKNSAKEGDADKNCLKCVVKEHTIIIDKVHGGSFNVNHRKGDNHFKNKNENDFSGFFDICNQNKGNIHVNTKNQKSDIPVICGTAIRENNVLKGGNLKSRSYGHNASTTSSKPKRLSPLSESNIEVLAAKMAVKINMTRLQKYTKPGVVRRSQSMDL